MTRLLRALGGAAGLASAGAILLAAACGESTPLERSCAGEAVPNCRAYEYAVVRAASVEPPGAPVGQPGATLSVRVELGTCGARAPGPHRVAIQALATVSGGLPDAGASARLFDLDEVLDDGATWDDAAAQDGRVEVTMPSFFYGDVPAETDMVLRFTPWLRTCEGAVLEVPYRTGARYAPPPPAP